MAKNTKKKKKFICGKKRYAIFAVEKHCGTFIILGDRPPIHAESDFIFRNVVPYS